MDGRSREGKTIRKLASQLDPFTLPSVNICNGILPLGTIPRKPGIYFLMEDSQVYYIGQSNSIGRRIRDVNHFSVKAMQQKFSMFQIAWFLHDGGEGTRLMLEKLLTRRFEPVLDKLNDLILKAWVYGKVDNLFYMGNNWEAQENFKAAYLE